MTYSPFGAQLAARLNDVRLPDGLLGRLRTIPLASDADFDRALAEVALPPDLADRLSAIAYVPHRAEPVLKRAAAAVAMFAIGVGYVFSVTAVVYSRFEQPLLAGESLRSAWTPSFSAAAGDGPWVTLPANPGKSNPDASVEPQDLPLDRANSDDASTAGAMGLVEPIVLADFGDPIGAPFMVSLATDSVDTVAEHFGGFAADRCRVHAPETSTAVAFEATGRALPWFDAVNHRAVDLELSADDASYRYCLREIESGHLPLDARVRVEEFLAAFDYDLFDYDLVDKNSAEQEGRAPVIAVAAGPTPYGSPDRLISDNDRSRWLVAVGIGTLGEVNTPRVTLKFSPDGVTAYRIVGYGLAPKLDGSPTETPEGRAGEPSDGTDALWRGPTVLLVEVELTDAESWPAALAEVQLAWHGPQGKSHAAQATLSRSSFSETFEAAPPGWRKAAVVALAAESLAGSPFAEHISLADVAVLARKIEQAADWAGWREFTKMIGEAQSLRLNSQSIRAQPAAKNSDLKWNHYRL